MPFSTSGRQRYAAYTNFQNCYQLSRSLRWRYNDLILFLLIALTQSASEQQHTELLDEKREAELLSDLFNETTLADSLNGFLLVVDSRSSIIYISPNVSRCLGLTQVCCIFRYIYLLHSGVLHFCYIHLLHIFYRWHFALRFFIA